MASTINKARKRKRCRRPRSPDREVPETAEQEGVLENQVANIPKCSPRPPQDMTSSTNCSTSTGLFVTSVGADPRPFSSCSRLAHRRSPSPARVVRQREHTELQVLNERLSSHAEHVKNLQGENARLRLQVAAMDDVIQRESRNMKQLHGSEIKTLQELIDTCNEEKSTISSLYEGEKLERERLGAELWDKDAEIVSLCERLDALKTVAEDYRKLRVEFEATEAALQESREDAERMSAELIKEKRSHRRLEQEASVNKERYLREVEEASTRFSEHMHQADQKMEEGYEALVSSALTSLRQQHVRDLEGLKAEMTSNYQSKITEWKAACELAQADLLAARREVKATRQDQDRLTDVVTQLKADKAALEVQVRESQARLEEARDRAERDRCQAQRDVALLTQELAEQREELEQIGGANSRLEAEINAYRLIVDDLEGQSLKAAATKEKRQLEEETIEPASRSRARKKKRTKDQTTDVETGPFDIFKGKDYFRTNEYSQGVEILDVDLSGRYITLINTTDHPTDLCLWTVQQTDGQQTVKYELGATTHLPKGKRLTLWSCEAGSGVADTTTLGVSGGGGGSASLSEAEPGTRRGRLRGRSRRGEARAGEVESREETTGRMDGGVSRETETVETAAEVMGPHSVDGADDDDIDARGRGVDITMSGKSWLKLDYRKLTVRVEDGDGQLQAKCDINTIADQEPLRRSSSTTATITTINNNTTSHISNSSSKIKRPRLGSHHHGTTAGSSNNTTNSSSTVRNNRSRSCASASSGESCSLKAGPKSSSPGRPLTEVGVKMERAVLAFDGAGGGETVRNTQDKDSCRIM